MLEDISRGTIKPGNPLKMPDFSGLGAARHETSGNIMD
jgi:hypothetical protein